MSDSDDYKVIRTYCKETLEAQVNGYILIGYKALGGVSVSMHIDEYSVRSLVYCQAVLRSSKQ